MSAGRETRVPTKEHTSPKRSRVVHPSGALVHGDNVFCFRSTPAKKTGGDFGTNPSPVHQFAPHSLRSPPFVKAAGQWGQQWKALYAGDHNARKVRSQMLGTAGREERVPHWEWRVTEGGCGSWEVGGWGGGPDGGDESQFHIPPSRVPRPP